MASSFLGNENRIDESQTGIHTKHYKIEHVVLLLTISYDLWNYNTVLFSCKNTLFLYLLKYVQLYFYKYIIYKNVLSFHYFKKPETKREIRRSLIFIQKTWYINPDDEPTLRSVLVRPWLTVLSFFLVFVH